MNIAIIVAVISLVGCIFTACFSLWGSFMAQYLNTYLSCKTKAYSDFLEALAVCLTDTATSNDRALLLSYAYTLSLYSSHEIGALAVLISNDIRNNSFDNQKAEAITRLMREDTQNFFNDSRFTLKYYLKLLQCKFQ